MHLDHTRAAEGVVDELGPSMVHTCRQVCAISSTAPVTWAGEIDKSAPSDNTDSIRFGIVMPVHNEEKLLPAALASLDLAISHVTGDRVALGITVVLDGCDDRSSDIVEDWRRRTVLLNGHIEILETNAHSVGKARRMGCQALLRRWSDSVPETIWLASTDADSEVPQNWICAPN